MTRVRVHNFTISLDGYGAGPHHLTELGYECTTHVPTAAATHVVLTKRGKS
jgi:hypothetical protein